jgi:hypothetical protein
MATYGRDKKKHKLKSKDAIKPAKFFFRSVFVASRQLVVDKNFVVWSCTLHYLRQTGENLICFYRASH